MTYEEFKQQEHEKLTRLVDAMIDSLSRGHFCPTIRWSVDEYSKEIKTQSTLLGTPKSALPSPSCGVKQLPTR